MNETGKKVLLIAVVLIALVAVAYQAFNMMKGDTPIVESKITMPADFKSEKQQAIDAQKGAPAGQQSGERDLGGPLTNN